MNICVWGGGEREATRGPCLVAARIKRIKSVPEVAAAARMMVM